MRINFKNFRYIALVIGTLIGIESSGQQETMLNQFGLNMMSINPAYAGYREVQSFSVVHRSQWVGYTGAPITDILSFDMPLSNESIAVGGAIMNDKIGPSSEFGFTANFAYRMRTSLKSTLSFGLQGYAGIYNANLTDLVLISEYTGQSVDPNFQENPDNIFLPNVGAGAMFHTKKVFLGLSSPKLIKNKLDNSAIDQIRTVEGKTEPTYFFTGGYTANVNSNLSVQPVLLFKGTEGAPLSMGGYLNFLFKDDWTIGLVYYHQEVAGVLAQVNLNDKMKVGYSFDIPTNDLVTKSYGSHEISATYELRQFTERLIYPRRF